MRIALAKAGGGIALGLSVLLLFAVTLGDGANVANLWTIVLCGAGGLLATHLRLVPAMILIVIGAIPALVGGVAFLYLPSVALVFLSAIAPVKASAAPNELPRHTSA